MATISSDILASYAADAAREVDGVFGLVESTLHRHKGVRILGDGKPQHNVAGERIAFIHPGDFLGALVELEEHR